MMGNTKDQIKMEEGPSMEDSAEMKIALVGKTGSGKSSLAHTIFGEEECCNKSVFDSETTKCEARTRDVNGKRITLIDTPGFFDTNMSEEKLKAEIVRCITEWSPGIHAFLILLKTERFTEHEQSVFTKMCEYFSEEALKHSVVVFTHGDQLLEGTKIDEFVHENKHLSNLMKKCGNRCHVFDNKYWRKGSVDEYRSNQFQVKELLNTVETMMKKNENSLFTNEMLQKVDEKIREKEEKIRRKAGNRSEEEIKQKAKDHVFRKMMNRLSGIPISVLLGALFGGLVGGKIALAASKTVILGAAVGGAVAGGLLGYVAGDKVADAAKILQNVAERAVVGVRDVARSFKESQKSPLDIKLKCF